MRRIFPAMLFFCAALFAAGPSLADTACPLKLVTSVATGIDGEGGVYVPMSISGHTVNLLIDTGGIDSMLTEATVAALELPTDHLRGGHNVMLFGGKRIDRFATGRDIIFGGLTASSMRFLVMPDGHMAPELGGTLAPDILRAYDDDFDFAHGRFNLISPEHCPAEVVYWTKDAHAQIAFAFDRNGHISFAVRLDGKEITVELDTGSSRSVFVLEAAERLFGFDENAAALTPTQERGLERVYRYPFRTMTFGGMTVQNPDIILIPAGEARLPASSAGHIILGLGVLRQLHLYIAYRERNLFVTPASAH